ncbi:MAG: sensor domain-containing protein [bacterium]
MLLKIHKTHIMEGLFLITVLAIAAILLFLGIIPIKKESTVTLNFLFKIAKLDKNITLIKGNVSKAIYYYRLKPLPSTKAHFKKVLSNLSLNLKKTDRQYKELDEFIKENSVLLKNNRQIISYFNKSYIRWKNYNKPAIKKIIKGAKNKLPQIAHKLLLKNSFYLFPMPIVKIISSKKLYFKKIVNISMYSFIVITFIVLLLSVLFFYYFNKFQEILLEGEEKFESMFNDQQSIGLVIDIKSGRIIDVNNAAVNFYGYSRDELLAMNINQINIYTPAEEHREYRQGKKVKDGNYIIFKHRLKNGDVKIVESRMSEFITGNKSCLLEIINDITEKITNEKWMNLLYEGIENSPDWMLITDRLGNIEYVNSGVENITGYKREELIGKNPRIFKSGLLGAEFYKTLWDSITSGEVFRGIFIDRRKNGELFTLNQTIVPIKSKEDSEITNFVSIAKDITQEKALEEELNIIHFYDPLTKFPNKNLFIISINQYLGSREYMEKKLIASLVIIDFYKLSYINNTYGYDTGDKLLQIFSKKLNKVIRYGDIIARIGGDEFGILFTKLKTKESILFLINRIKEEFKNPLNIEEISPIELQTGNPAIAGANKTVSKSFNIAFTMGISTFPDDGKNAEDLLKSADIALSNAKGQGAGEYEFFKDSMNDRASEFLLMRNNLINAFKNREFLIYYQPYFDIKTRKICGMEALARWNDKDAGMIPPMKFIPIIEEMGFIHQFEEFLIDNICRNLKVWKEKGLNIVPVSMNISPTSFRKEGLIDMIISILDRYEISSSLLNIEITEGVFIKNLDYALKIFNAFKERGFKISLDDFGTGYSSLSYIKNIPADFIKIDISFIRGMMDNPKDLAIVNTVVVLASKLGMKTIAEGVETEEQLEILKYFGCDMVQGYLFSKPVPENEILTLNQQAF